MVEKVRTGFDGCILADFGGGVTISSLRVVDPNGAFTCGGFILA